MSDHGMYADFREPCRDFFCWLISGIATMRWTDAEIEMMCRSDYKDYSRWHKGRAEYLEKWKITHPDEWEEAYKRYGKKKTF